MITVLIIPALFAALLFAILRIVCSGYRNPYPAPDAREEPRR